MSTATAADMIDREDAHIVHGAQRASKTPVRVVHEHLDAELTVTFRVPGGPRSRCFEPLQEVTVVTEHLKNGWPPVLFRPEGGHSKPCLAPVLSTIIANMVESEEGDLGDPASHAFQPTLGVAAEGLQLDAHPPCAPVLTKLFTMRGLIPGGASDGRLGGCKVGGSLSSVRGLLVLLVVLCRPLTHALFAAFSRTIDVPLIFDQRAMQRADHVGGVA